MKIVGEQTDKFDGFSLGIINGSNRSDQLLMILDDSLCDPHGSYTPGAPITIEQGVDFPIRNYLSLTQNGAERMVRNIKNLMEVVADTGLILPIEK
jgi:hypothetical protein